MSPATSIKINYDRENDILYVRRDGFSGTRNIDVSPGVVLMIDPKTRQAIGYTIHNFSSQFPELVANYTEWLLMEMFDFNLESINSSQKHITQ